MRLAESDARARFAAARVARLATVGAAGQPHLVPVTFGFVDPATVVFAVDHKPKTSDRLRRLANIAVNPRVSLLVDEYADDDWTRLWWVRADGRARVVEPPHDDHDRAVSSLVKRYPQYAERPPVGPAIVVAVDRWSGWAYADRKFR